jgi:hypothetical protein
MQQRSWKVDNLSARKKIACLLWNSKTYSYYSSTKTTSGPYRESDNPIHFVSPNFFNVNSKMEVFRDLCTDRPDDGGSKHHGNIFQLLLD